jgi:hypothetical protein
MRSRDQQPLSGGGFVMAGLCLIAGAGVLMGDVSPPEGSATPEVMNTWSGGVPLSERASEPCRRPYSPDSPWNTPVGREPEYHPQSDLHVGAIEGELTSDPTQYTYPVYEVTRATPTRPVELSGVYTEVYDGGRKLRVQEGGVVRLPIPVGAEAAEGSDQQIILVNWETGDEWGAWQLRRDDEGWTATNSSHYNLRWDAVAPGAFGARGAGIPYFAGLVRPCEVARRRIDHALAFAYDFPTPEHVYPATKSDGESDDPADMPEGSRLQLDPSIPASEIRDWGCIGPCLTIARALQKYGMYVIDQSGRPKVMLEYEGTAHWGGAVDAATVSPIPLSAFKLVRP